MDLEAVDSMIPSVAPRRSCPPPCLRTNPTHLSDCAQTPRHVAHTLSCLWRWGQLPLPGTRPWTAECRFKREGRQHVKALPNQQVGNHPTTTNMCPNLAVHHIRGLAGGVPPTIYKEKQKKSSIRERDLQCPSQLPDPVHQPPTTLDGGM